MAAVIWADDVATDGTSGTVRLEDIKSYLSSVDAVTFRVDVTTEMLVADELRKQAIRTIDVSFQRPNKIRLVSDAATYVCDGSTATLAAKSFSGVPMHIRRSSTASLIEDELFRYAASHAFKPIAMLTSGTGQWFDQRLRLKSTDDGMTVTASLDTESTIDEADFRIGPNGIEPAEYRSRPKKLHGALFLVTHPLVGKKTPAFSLNTEHGVFHARALRQVLRRSSHV
ncbi:MAG: hypothetical protein KDA87_06685 [Planctomycetales bacterium]|nr:hypothetical protein [Planctomycetales bacterium]